MHKKKKKSKNTNKLICNKQQGVHLAGSFLPVLAILTITKKKKKIRNIEIVKNKGSSYHHHPHCHHTCDNHDDPMPLPPPKLTISSSGFALHYIRDCCWRWGVIRK